MSRSPEVAQEPRYVFPLLTDFYRSEPFLKTANSTLYLVKYYDRLLNTTNDCIAKVIKRGTREYDLAISVNNKYVLRPLGCAVGSTLRVIFTPYCELGSIEDLIQKSSKPFTERYCRLIFKQMVKAVRAVHRNNILHNDIKPPNFLIEDTIKLTDFGLAKSMKGLELYDAYVGTPLFMAPEVINKAGHTYPADIWSLGVTLYYMYFGAYPYEGHDVTELKYRIFQCPLRFHDRPVSDEFKNLVMWMLKIKSSKRPTIEEVRDHPWLDPATAVQSARTPNTILGNGYSTRMCQSSPAKLIETEKS